MRPIALVLCIVFLAIPLCGESLPSSFDIRTPTFVLTGVEFSMELSALRPNGGVDTAYRGTTRVEGVHRIEGGASTPVSATFVRGKAFVQGVRADHSGSLTIRVIDRELVWEKSVRAIPGVLSILPPLLAILLALTLRQVIVSLFAGVWLGALFIFDYNPLTAVLRTVDHFIVQAMANADHVAIIVFTFLFGGMVGVISRNGGTQGIANALVAMARSARRGQVATWLLGIAIFFDDYASTLITGNTMRPVTDRLKISREKLAYIVDSTSAPIASLFFISSWIGYEVGLIDDAIKAIDYHVESAYSIFIETIPYRFYPIFTLVIGFVVALSGRDIGPMRRAEERARLHGKLMRDGAQPATEALDEKLVRAQSDFPQRWWNGAIPILTVVVVGLFGLYYTGVESIKEAGGTDFSVSNIIGSANSYKALQWAALLSCFVALVMSVGQRILTVIQAMEAWFNGIKAMLLAMIILVLAWSIGSVTTELHTADYVVKLLSGQLAPHWLPVVTFIVSGLISFATGTSWGTMAIIMPLVIPLSVSLSAETGLSAAATHTILLGSVSSVLAGSVFGDHCSPISDTTILSSMASACDHIDHVRTQLPYALVAALVGMLFGDIPTAFGLSPYVSLVIGGGVSAAIILIVGRSVSQMPAPGP